MVSVLEPKVLLISNKEDLSLDYVVAELAKHSHSFFRLNSEDLLAYSSSFFLDQKLFILRNEAVEIRLGQNLRSVIYRRPGQPYTAGNQQQDSLAIQKYVCDQWSVFITGLRSLSQVVWINSPEADSFCENKIVQLSVAQDLGFELPKTLISTDQISIQNFFLEQDSECVAKALSSPLLELEDGDYFVFSNIIKSLDSISNNEFNSAPTIFQERVKNKIDVRVTVCGNQIFAVEILRKSLLDVPFDWRTCEEELSFIEIILPEELQQKCFQLVRHFGLVFGALDFVRSGDKFVFLEINPAGEWGWLQRKAGLNIAEAVVASAVKAFVNHEMV